ncbi:MAG: hypothetical protein LUG24_05100 [Clostridiales bacterium]|nr:hypothetical protein [Clostridiales bacterium]
MIEKVLNKLIFYGLERGLIEKDDEIWARNTLMGLLKLSDWRETEEASEHRELYEILEDITDYAAEKGLVNDDITSRDLFDTAVMGLLTPRPSSVRKKFWNEYKENPEKATNWYYGFSGDTYYIRRSLLYGKYKTLWENRGEGSSRN